MNKISAVYQIVNEATGDRYVGSSMDVMKRWADHKCPSTWNKCPNKPLYQDFQKYGLGNFRFQILAPVMPECLKQVEQEFIEMLKPAYNNYSAKGRDVERLKKSNRKACRKYRQTEKGKEAFRKTNRKYKNQLCLYNGETLTMNTLAERFRKAGIEHSVTEAKKYLL